MNFSANIFQLDKTNENTSFDFSIKGTADKKELTPKVIAEFFAAKLFKVVNAQKSIQNKIGKSRFLKLAKSKKLYFSFICDTFEFNTELEQSLCFAFSVGELTEKQFCLALSLVLEIILDNNKI